MITAVMIGPNGEKLNPRYERLIFDTLEQCQMALANPDVSMAMSTSVQLAYPGYLLEQIGCGAWNMEDDIDSPLELQS
jgi:hypothetical protein